jgi:hypothetical protein
VTRKDGLSTGRGVPCLPDEENTAHGRESRLNKGFAGTRSRSGR